MTDWFKALKTLGEALGIEPHYTDNWGRVLKTGAQSALEILKAKGVRVEGNRGNLQTQVSVVSIENLPESFSVYFPGQWHEEPQSGQEGWVHVSELEGKVPETFFSSACGRASISNDEDTGLLRVTIPFPRGLELGQYRFRIGLNGEGIADECLWLLAVCPERAYMPPPLEQGKRIAGIGVALYGVRSQRNWGVGDFTDLKRLVAWAKDSLAADFVGLNPLHAIFNKRPYNSSPYLPSSRLYRNFIYLDVTAIPDFEACPSAVEIYRSPETRSLIGRLRQEEHVNYEEVAGLKLMLLREVFGSFVARHGSRSAEDRRWREFEEYRLSQGVYLEQFATFCALRDYFVVNCPSATSWWQWPEAYRDPSSAAVSEFREAHAEEVLFWMYLQWQIEEQLEEVQKYALQKGMMIGLYHDEALAVDRDGADFWALKDFYHEDFRVGAPPDAFAPDGQDWGFPPPDGERMRDAAYAPFLKKLEVNCRFGGALRIDHVMQLHHLFWIPPGGKPCDGVYVKEREEDLLNLVALQSRRSRTLVIGEDLGTVPFDFRDRLMNKGVFSYRLFYFERDLEGTLRHFYEYPENVLVSITTHDLPTLVGFWSGRDIELRRNIGQLDDKTAATFREERTRHKAKIIERLVQDGMLPAHVAHAAWESPVPTEELHSAVLRFLFKTPAKLVQINQEDIFQDDRQQNVPGTTWQNPNWVTKMRFTVEELDRDPEALRLAEKFRILLRDVGRGSA